MNVRNYQRKIQELYNVIERCKREIEELKIKMHNEAMEIASDRLSGNAKLSETEAENIFYEIAMKKKINLKRQYKINIIRKKDNYIERFYFADFCDVKNKVVFEVDGGYHFTDEQRKKDARRTYDLKRMGYKVFRISNSQIYNGKATQFLIDCYNKIKKPII